MSDPRAILFKPLDKLEGSAFLPFVFEPFRQADHSANDKHKGLGLGLSIVHRIIELHGGTIKANSAGCGKGAVFTIRLPVKPNAVAKANQCSPFKTARLAANKLF
jgi:K+-sensing histidine kinase KdpD